MENYQKKLDEIIKTQEGHPKLALHSCCGPCSSYVLEYLKEYFDITLFYYNPNIYPAEEYDHRLREQLRLCDILQIPAIACEYRPEIFLDAVKGLEEEPEGGARCAKCFALRLDYTASYAQQRGFLLLTTTLTVSPHKNAQIINQIGQTVAERHGIHWLPSDFKKKNGYLRSIQLSQQFELYRQNYCGCKFSFRDTQKK